MKNKFYLKIYSVKRKKWTYFINTFILCFVIFKFLISSKNITINLVSIIILMITICFNSFSSWLNGADSLFAWKNTKTIEYSPYVSIKIKKSEANYQVTFKNTGRGELYNLNIMFEKESLLKTILKLDINLFDYGVNLRQNEQFTLKIFKDKNDIITQIIESITLTYEDLLGQPYSQNIRIICLDSKEVVCLSQKPFIIDNPYTKNRTF